MEVELGFVESTESYELEAVLFPSKVGGKPAWLSQVGIPNHGDLKCCDCGSLTRFLLQIYAPRDNKVDCFHRTVYIFCCTRSHCFTRNCNTPFKAFRSQLPRRNEFFDYEPVTENALAAEILKKMDLLRQKWGSMCNICGCPASKELTGSQAPYYCVGHQTQSDQSIGWTEGHQSEGAASLDNAGALLVRKSLSSFNFPEFELVIEPEAFMPTCSRPYLFKSKERPVDNHRLPTFEKLENGLKLDNVSCEDLTCPEDKHFERFRNTVATDNNQVLRYSYNGHPSWISSEHIPLEFDIPKCSCGSRRIFEFQILPQLLIHLDVDSTQGSIDWGTLAVYTCADNCLSGDQYVPEFVWKQDFSDTSFKIQ